MQSDTVSHKAFIRKIVWAYLIIMHRYKLHLPEQLDTADMTYW